MLTHWHDVKHLRDFSLVPISGAFHIPLLTSLRREWFTAQRTTTTGWTRQQRLKLSQHRLNQDDTYQFFQQQIHQTVTNLLYTSTPDLQTLHNTLNQFTCSSFFHLQPDKGPATEIRPFRQFQDHTRLLRRLRGKEMAHIFKAWFHVCKRSQARQAMTIAARQKRKLRLDQIFQAADLAEKAHDHFTLFRHIRSLAPKQPLKQILLRSEQGELLGPDDAADWLQRWYHDLYSDGDSNFLISDFTWPFTQEEFTQGLQSLPIHKALAPAFTPAPFWKYGAEPISQYLAQMFHDCCDAKDFPDSWSTGTIAMLVKPGKSGRHPSELRPIALLEPTGKTVMGLLTTAIQQQIQPFMNRLPQFAYAVGRGTEDAIHRLTEHCRRVRITLQNFCHPIHNLKQGRDLPSVIGGMTLCLDLTRAFDTVHRQRLFQSLEKLGISSNLISLLKCVYNKTTYEFFHRGTHRSVKTCRGIRQGCRAAPCLWTVFISTLMLDIEQHISPQFLLLCITIFADDICSHQMFDSEESFLKLIKSFGILLDLIEGANLDINLAKTTVTLRMRGKLVSKLQKRFLVRTQQGTFIKIPRSNGTYTKIKLVRSFKYLGVMLSYYNFEKETMALRLKHSEQSGHLLHRWLYTQRLSAPQRVKLWYQCIYTCLRYGILATGFNETTLLPFYRFSIKQMRRILRDPVHLSHESNLSFLTRHNLPDPLLRLRDICLQTAARLLHRQGTLADDDVLRLTPLPNYDQLLQVIDKVYERVHSDYTLTEVPDFLTPHICPHCNQIFYTLAALRRHCTVEHGQRSGLLRLMDSQPQTDTPTCHRCGMQFSTWHRYHYHTMYVCQLDLQEIDQVEHRLRVQELLQFARAHQVAALRHNPDALLYFLHHCAICGKFHTTETGLMRHWNDAHSTSHKAHLPVLQHYAKHVDTGNPCCLCSTSFSQYHRCIIWRQLAMLLTDSQMTAAFCDVTEHTNLQCVHCGKAYTTRHGLTQHIQKFHNAQQVLHSNNWDHFTAKCLFDQAVQTNRCEDLLSNPDIHHFISSECFDCSMPFRRRQDLSKHLKQGHPSEWAEMEQRAAELTVTLNSAQRCFCEPPQHRAKHICMVFLQFSLARIQWEREQGTAGSNLPPDLALKPQEKLEQLLWFGFGHLLYRLPDLKLALTTHCQFCGFMCRTGDALVYHLYREHEALVAESSIQLQLLRWVLFQDFGCACNPTRGHGVPDHTCPALIQAAMLCVQAHWQLTIPWAFKTSDLLSHIGDLLPLHDFKRICLWLLTRQFGNLWRDPALLGMLKRHCTICGEAVSLQYIIVHLQLEHQLGANDLHPVVAQLCRIFSAEHSEDQCCDHCGDLLPTMDVLTFDPVPELHLPGCPLILHLAASLMHPVLQKSSYDPLAWPTPQAIENAFRRQEHHRLMFNVQPPDSAGREFDALVSCGHQILRDELVLTSIKHQCLICHKTFYMPGALEKHLRQHDYKQYNTMWCHKRLLLTCASCPCCGSDFHIDSPNCPALLNLAVLLANGRHPRQGDFHLGLTSDTRATSELRNPTGLRGQAIQEAQAQRQGLLHHWFDRRSDVEHAEDDGTCHSQARRLHSRAASRISVCDVSPTRGRKLITSLTGLSSSVAEGGSHSDFATYNGPSCHGDGKGTPRQTEASSSQCRRGPGLHPLQPHRSEPDDAVPEVGCWSEAAGSKQGKATSDWRSGQDLDAIVHILQSEPEITLRFHAVSKLQTEDTSGKTIPFLWTVGNRTQGELWNLLRTVSYHSIWQLVRLTLRPQTQQRSALAKQLEKMM